MHYLARDACTLAHAGDVPAVIIQPKRLVRIQLLADERLDRRGKHLLATLLLDLFVQPVEEVLSGKKVLFPCLNVETPILDCKVGLVENPFVIRIVLRKVGLEPENDKMVKAKRMNRVDKAGGLS